MLPAHVRGARPTPVLVAAMAPKALRVTGELADGTVPYLAGPKALAERIIPAVTAAAAAAAATTDEQARHTMAEGLSFCTQFESYRRVLALNGTENPVDVVLIGDEDHVAKGLRGYADAG